MSNYLVTELIGNGTYITIDRADCGGLMSDPMAIEFTKLIQRANKKSKYIHNYIVANTATLGLKITSFMSPV